MDGMGERLRARARQLGWSDAEVARRANLAQTRYANYVTGRYEPDLATLVRICTVLGVGADHLLGRPVTNGDQDAGLRARALAAMDALGPESLAIVVAVIDGLVATSGREPEAPAAPVRPRRASRGRRTTPPAG